MASSTPHTIAIQGGAARLEETSGEAAIKPGHLLAVSSGEVIKHATADGTVLPVLVALEAVTAAGVAKAAIDSTYDDGDTVYYAVGQPGDVFYMWLATGNNAVDGVSPLGSNGDGTLKVVTVAAGTLEGSTVGVPVGSLNNASGSAQRLKVRIS